jgi:methylated-DNA-[protein]-cysteine S-methyltransferase
VFDDYFSRRTADVGTPVDLRLAHGFRREALVALRGVPAGTTVAYRELAELAGRPRAVRAAASACATNPVPIVVPCHRVVRSDGTLGAYGPGQPAKRTLLALEGVVVPG